MPREILVQWNKLPQIRRDPLTGDTVIISPQRQRELKKEEVTAYPPDLPEYLASCHFCLGNEEMIPQILAEEKDPLTGQVLARAFPNLRPMLMIEDPGQIQISNPFFREFLHRGIGAHELVVELPKHNTCLSLAPEELIVAVIRVLAKRYFDLMGDQRFDWFFAFKNFGLGTSQVHPHWQLEARRFVPKGIWERYERMRQWREERGECLLCRLWREEEKAERAVLKTEQFIAFVPSAPKEPFEVIIAPQEHYPSFTSLLTGELTLEFARILKGVMIKVKKVLQGKEWEQLSDPHYLFSLYTGPMRDSTPQKPYHWHLAFLPRTTQKAGHEWGTSEDVIPIFPEETAELLRLA